MVIVLETAQYQVVTESDVFVQLRIQSKKMEHVKKVMKLNSFNIQVRNYISHILRYMHINILTIYCKSHFEMNSDLFLLDEDDICKLYNPCNDMGEHTICKTNSLENPKPICVCKNGFKEWPKKDEFKYCVDVNECSENIEELKCKGEPG